MAKSMSVSQVVARRPQSGVERIKDYVLNMQNPGKRRNFTVRDSQAVETTLFQRTSVINVLPPGTTSRMAGYAESGE